MAPASMSDASVAKLGAEVVKIMGAPDIDEKHEHKVFALMREDLSSSHLS